MSAICWSVAASSCVWTVNPSRLRSAPPALATPIVTTRMPRSAACWATSIGSGRSVFSPSLSSTMTVDASLPGGTGAGADDGSGERLL